MLTFTNPIIKIMMNLFIKSTKFFFVLSIIFFLSALLIHNAWIPELISSLAILHALSSIVFIIIFCIFGLRRWAIGSVVFFAGQVLFLVLTHMNSVPLVNLPSADSEDEILRVAQYNTLYHNARAKDIVDWIEKNHDRFDIIFLQEVSMDLQQELQRLNKIFPHQVYKRDILWFGRAFLSQVPIGSHEIKFHDNSRVHYMTVNLETSKGKPITFYGLHLTSPYTPDALDHRNDQILELSKIISQNESDYKIMAGDFNMTPHSTAFGPMCEQAGLKKTNDSLRIVAHISSLSPSHPT